MSKKPLPFHRDLAKSLDFLRNTPDALSILRESLNLMHTSTSPVRWDDFMRKVHRWQPEHARPLTYFLSKESASIPKELKKDYPQECSALELLKTLYGEEVVAARAAYEKPLGLKSIMNDFDTRGKLESPVIFCRNDGQYLSFVFGADEVAFLPIFSLAMLEMYLNNGGALGAAEVKALEKAWSQVASKLNKEQQVAAGSTPAE